MFINGTGQQKRNHRSKGSIVKVSNKNTLPQVYLSETKDALPEIFLQEPGTVRSASNFKWLVSTCIAACVGIAAIGMVMYAAMDIEDGTGIINSFQKASLQAMKPAQQATIVNNTLRVASRKTDRLEVSANGLSTKHIIHDRISQRRGNRDFITVKPYAHIIASLSTVRPKEIKNIPPFNPFKIYSNKTPLLESLSGKSTSALNSHLIRVNMVDLHDSTLLNDDGQKLTLRQIQKLVAEAGEIYAENDKAIRPALYEKEYNDQKVNKEIPPRTTVVEKTIEDDDLPEQRELHSIKIKRGDSVIQLIRQVTPEGWQANSISEAMSEIIPPNKIQAGQELRFILVPTLQDNSKLEPLSVSLFSGKKHKVTVARNSAGEYVASADPVDLTVVDQLASSSSFPKRSTLYTSMYHAAMVQQLSAQKITSILKIHAYDVDFKRRVQAGDKFEVFFDVNKNASNQDGTPGELLYTSATVGGIERRFYRFRTPDGAVDFYDENGSSAKKFLMRKPVRGGRYTSGFGYRIHPVLKVRKMHTGTDWAAPTGTPILAAGDGIVEFVGVRGGYGKYTRLRHANGYKTAYAHLHRFAKGIKKGMKVRQGQVIGYVGSTGRSTGPHLHYEVLVNNRHVNPMKIEVPRGRVLKGRQLAEFNKERARIDRLMRYSPVKTRVAKIEENT